jgi:transposase-like protein
MSKPEGFEPKFTRQITYGQFDAMFPNEEACWTYLMARRWPAGARCARCGNEKVYESKARPWHWQCLKCGPKPRSPYRFSLKTGTIFEETKIPLLNWFKVLFLMLTSKKGISALQIHRMLGFGSYKTAWYMCMRLRASMHDPEFQQLMGIVEVDETFIGGKEKNKHRSQKERENVGAWKRGKRGGAGKAEVIGAIARKGSVVCQMVDRSDFRAHETFVRRVVDRKVELVATDEARHFWRLDRLGVRHDFINHSQGEYVRGNVHTNTIESFWSLIKRGIMGSYHQVSKKYLPLYLAEFQFRFNNRHERDIFGKAIAGC